MRAPHHRGVEGLGAQEGQVQHGPGRPLGVPGVERQAEGAADHRANHIDAEMRPAHLTNGHAGSEDRESGTPAVAAIDGAADHALLPEGALGALDDKGNVRTLAEVELEMIKFAIAHYDGQMSEVARRLGIGRSTLYRKLKEYGIDPEAGRG